MIIHMNLLLFTLGLSLLNSLTTTLPSYAFLTYSTPSYIYFLTEIFIVLHLNNCIVCLCVFVSIPDNSSVLQRRIRTLKTTSSSSDCHL
jgi:hypothetical protein